MGTRWIIGAAACAIALGACGHPPDVALESEPGSTTTVAIRGLAAPLATTGTTAPGSTTSTSEAPVGPAEIEETTTSTVAPTSTTRAVVVSTTAPVQQVTTIAPTLPPTTTSTAPAKRPPVPFTGQLSAEEQAIYAKFPGLILDESLMAAARGGQRPTTVTDWSNSQIFTAAGPTFQQALDGIIPNGNVLVAGRTHIGVGVRMDHSQYNANVIVTRFDP